MKLSSELFIALEKSLTQVDTSGLSPSAAANRVRRLAELLATGPQNSAQFITLAAVALAGAEACRLRTSG